MFFLVLLLLRMCPRLEVWPEAHQQTLQRLPSEQLLNLQTRLVGLVHSVELLLAMLLVLAAEVRMYFPGLHFQKDVLSFL